MYCLHLLKTSQRMTFTYQLGDWSLVERPCDQEDDVVNHVSVGDVVQEHGEGPGGLVPHVLELGHQLLPQLVLDDRHLETALVGEKVAVVGGLKMKLKILECFALHQVKIIILTKDS